MCQSMSFSVVPRYLAPVLLAVLLGSSAAGGPGPGPGPAAAGPTFTNPLLPSGPDPWVVQKDGFYYVMVTTGNSLVIRKTAKMSELSQAPATRVWSPQPQHENTRNVWAPELHFLDGKWYIYYTAGPDGQNCCGGQRSWVLENASPDPTQGPWVEKARLASPGADFWSIDMTVFELRGKRYALWSGQEAGSDQQNIYISAMSNPWTLTGPRTLLSKPEFEWELNGTPKVNEGPEILQHKGKTFLIFSASHCSTDTYALGQLTLTGRDPLVASNWKKSPEPVFVNYAASFAYGPGHNSFFKSKDGSQDWIIYHANNNPREGCGNPRSPRMQQFTWNRDGSPNFGKPVATGKPLARPAGE
ncbi:family 43 glycosylhydrolase [Hymenobacter setariae]|uniref:Family 43 glycosylhydrolase n=2 Tax=Hymenobacter setariae TaxID=2594794 RepID=A0A558BPB7_9BACT|nr:family 43 glycosylhydrolase [Hymenobacter setariae]